VLRSSVQTIRRYHAATEHLLCYVQHVHPIRLASHFRASHAEEFVRYLRALEVSAERASQRTQAATARRWHQVCVGDVPRHVQLCRETSAPPAVRREPFAALEIDRMPIENARPLRLFTPAQEKAFLEACDTWQFPVFFTLLLTGLRPGELTRLLLPEDVDLTYSVLRVRNKPSLGWQVKTRNEREVPLVPVLAQVLRHVVDGRSTGPVFRRRRFAAGLQPPLSGRAMLSLEAELARRAGQAEDERRRRLSRAEWLIVARGLWRDLGAIKTDRLRLEFMAVSRKVGLPAATAPKLLRHLFATALQEGRVDPLIRNELMGHAPAGGRKAGHGLGMTAVYTHTRPETRREQLEAALANRPAVAVAETYFKDVT
jgi:integrase